MQHILFFVLLIISLPTFAQSVTISGQARDASRKTPLAFVTVTLHRAADSSLVAGTVSGDDGRFSIPAPQTGNYLLKLTVLGYATAWEQILTGRLSNFLDLGHIDLAETAGQLKEVTVTGKQADGLNAKMDKQTYSMSANVARAGGSVLEAMANLPGVTVTQEGKVQLRGNDKVMVLIDGQQTALTGYGGQASLGNISASAIEKIEIINNPSARYDANGNAGIVNIIFKKEKKEGWNGKLGMNAGLGALWEKEPNFPGIRPQYRATPKINPSVSLNYRKNRVNLFFQGDNLYTHTLNKNEFTDRFYANGDTIRQQLKRNRRTNVTTGKAGADWFVDDRNTLTVSGLYSREKILDDGDQPFFDNQLKKRHRLWQFLEDEIKITATASLQWQRLFPQAGRKLQVTANYTFHREDEQYFFTNINPTFTGVDSFKLLSDEHVADISIDYVHPLKFGRAEGGFKFRRRYIPTNMRFIPGLNSPLDTTAGGWADYSETIPAIYGNYILEREKWELEAGLRVEAVQIEYDVNPSHRTYKSDGYSYTQPFPTVRIAYKPAADARFSFFYNRRVDRPNEVDIRIFPKYDDAEIIKVGNPGLRPQFTDNFELGYTKNWAATSLYAAAFHKSINATITRIASTVPGSTLIYNIFQNAGRSFNTGLEANVSRQFGKAQMSLYATGYKNVIRPFSVVNQYPEPHTFSAEREELISGNVKLNGNFRLPGKTDVQVTAVWMAPDIIPQGRIYGRFYVDAGMKKTFNGGRSELTLNATDLAGTLRIKRKVDGDGFHYTSTDYYETQVIRAGYAWKF
ncbi:TonB-dependent receptor domain-containing protein [Chitinophaga caseinilytica]|uniref:TonB-dependent receptor n=1 Tax=Chitinophaga caseinilytica TaxID=2267521 RepID=A0ABZ2Z1V1_9BACT